MTMLTGFDPRITVRPFVSSAMNGAAHEKPQSVATLIRGSDVKPEPIDWLWKNWIARGKLHVLAGTPGVGKSTIAMKMAAAVSAGTRWPDGTSVLADNVIIWSAEDDVADTLVPRLDASGADLRRVQFVSGLATGEESRPFDPARDVEALRAAIKEIGGAALIIVDPIVSATAGDSHKNSETRRGLQPLVDLATELNAAILGITHFTKGSEGRSPIDRVTGSVAFGALARIVLIAAKGKDKGDDEQASRILMRAKSNIGPDDGGFKYDLQLTPMLERPDIIASAVVWGEAIEGTARDVLAEAESEGHDDGDGARFGEARDWLLDFITAAPQPANDCLKASRDAGHAKRTIERAKSDLGIVSMKREGRWLWGLPQDQDRQAPEAKDATSPYPGGVGGLGGVQENQTLTEQQDRQDVQR